MPITQSELTAPELEIFNSLTSDKKSIYLDLSDEVRKIVGRWAPPNGCISDQVSSGVCQPDPRVTSQVGIRKPTNWDSLSQDDKYNDTIYRYRLKDSKKGDLLLTPGGPSGMIGALLNALTPPQDYSHMGIVIEDDGTDGIVVRHCTASEDWMLKNLFATGKIFNGLPIEMDIPLHGIRSDAIKFTWPGTITQSVEIAYKSHRDALYYDELYELDNSGNFLWEDDEKGEPQKILRDKFAVLDPIVFDLLGESNNRGTGGRYRINALTFDEVSIAATDLAAARVAYPLIVQPCRYKRTAPVLAALNRIVDECKLLRGHYRLYSYTNGHVGELNDGPVTLEGLNEPACVGGLYTVNPVDKTRGMVCSTFIWQAIQLANAKGSPHILVDGRPTYNEPANTRDDKCSFLTNQWGLQRKGSSLQSAADPIDGFYNYSINDRMKAAEALNKKMVEKVMKNIDGVMDDITGPPWLGALEGGFVGAALSQILSVNPLIAALILGVSKAYLDSEIEKIRDTATHMSNQLGDTFQKDNASLDNESVAWRTNPGTGNTVSPDDILNSWASPYFSNENFTVGLYGSNIRAEVLSPAPIEGDWKPSTWEISTDRTNLGVRVFYKLVSGSPVYLQGALVIVGCAETVTIAADPVDIIHTIDVPTGQYFARAVWTDTNNNNFQWRSPRRIVVVPGPHQDIEVFPPKESRRQIRISGDAELLNRHKFDGVPIIGGEAWEVNTGFDSQWILMGMDFSHINEGDDPEFYAWLKSTYGNDLKGLQDRLWIQDFQMEDWGIARFIFNCVLDPTGSISLTIKAGTRDSIEPDSTDEFEWGDVVSFLVPPKRNNGDPGFEFNIKVERTGPAYAPVRASLKVIVDNNQQPG